MPEIFWFFLLSVCDDACREFVLDQSSGLLLCTISGHCFERWLCPDDEWDADDTVSHLQSSLLFFFPLICMYTVSIESLPRINHPYPALCTPYHFISLLANATGFLCLVCLHY